MIYSIRKKQFMFVLTSIYIYFSSHNGCKKLVSNELNICVKFKGFFLGGGVGAGIQERMTYSFQIDYIQAV